MKILSILAAAFGLSFGSRVGWGNHADSPMNLEPRLFLARDSAGWKEFRNKFGHLRKFRNSTEEEFHARIFQDSEAMVKAQNDKFARGESGFHLALNQFADMTEAEYRSRLLTITKDDVERMKEGSIALDMSSVMAGENSVGRRKREVDWTYLSPTGDCGSCYAFASVAAIEAHVEKKYGAIFSLSEQDIVDCSSAEGNLGCDGGFMPNTFKYILKSGINHAELYPYTGEVGTCRHTDTGNFRMLKGFTNIPSGNETMLQAALNNVGPVIVAVNSSPDTFKFYSGGIYDEPNCDPNALDHVMLAVGLLSENGKPYYLIKNSWGRTTWGEDGFVRMAAGKDMCGISRMCSYPVV